MCIALTIKIKIVLIPVVVLFCLFFETFRATIFVFFFFVKDMIFNQDPHML